MFRNDLFNLNNAYLTVVNEGTVDYGPEGETQQGISNVVPTVLVKQQHEKDCKCNKCNKNSEECECNANSNTDEYTENDDSEMAKNELYNAVYHAISIYNKLKTTPKIEAWVQSKITKAADYLNSVKHYLDHENSESPVATEENEEQNLISALDMGSSEILSQLGKILRKESKENLQKLLYEVVKAIETKN